MTLVMKILIAVFALGIAVLAQATPPPAVRVGPEALPDYIHVEITPTSCTDLAAGYEGVWYATVKARVSDIEPEVTSISVRLRDPDSGMFLFNPGTNHQIEDGYLLHSIAFNELILDQVVFQFREGMKAIYEIHLGDFYSGETC